MFVSFDVTLRRRHSTLHLSTMTGMSEDGVRAWVLMGPSGCGKSSVGAALRDALASSSPDRPPPAFVDGDDLHAPEARAKMSRGEPLDEADRAPWLDRLASRTTDLASENPARDVVLACSALRARHRDALRTAARADRPGVASIQFILLDVPRDVLAARLAARRDHFFDPSLLDSQLATLEPGGSHPDDVVHVVDANLPSPDDAARAVVERVIHRVAWEEGMRAFLDRWWDRALAAGLGPELDPTKRVIDHACYRCGTASEYRETIASLESAGHVVAGCSEIGGRDITTVRLSPPVRWREWDVPAVEVPMPKPGRPKPNGWEHAEVALMEGGFRGADRLDALRARIPGANWDEKGAGKEINPELSVQLGDGMCVKFHNRPLLEVVALEIAHGTARGPDPFSDAAALFGLELKEPWASAVLDGSKTIETRTYDLPAALVGKPLVLLSTPEGSGGVGTSGLPDAAPRGAAVAKALVTFEETRRWATRDAWAADGGAHGVPTDEDGPYAWRAEDAGTPREVRGWVVREVLPMRPTPSPPMLRLLRSLFRLEASAEELLGEDDEDQDQGEDQDERGRLDDDGENDRPWH